MLKNYYNIDPQTSINAFLKETSEKKNMHYIILDTTPKSFVDVKQIVLKGHEGAEKIKSLKKTLPICSSNKKSEQAEFLINSGEPVIESPKGYFDYLDALEVIKSSKLDFLKSQVHNDQRKEVYALTQDDSIDNAKHMFTDYKVNLLPVIDNFEIVGELRSMDLLNSAILSNKKNPSKVTSVMNNKPLKLDYTSNFEDLISKLLEKKVPSIIIQEENRLYSIITYRDIFKLYKKYSKKEDFTIEYVNTSLLFEDEVALIKTFATRAMRKIARVSLYKHLKVALKTHGNTTGSHTKTVSVNLQLIEGNKSIHVDKEIIRQISDEFETSKKKTEQNPVKMIQQAFKTLEVKVMGSREKKKGTKLYK